MTDLTSLLARRDQLEECLASGVRTVETGDKRLTYATTGEMTAALAAINRQIATAQGMTISTIVFETSKGN